MIAIHGNYIDEVVNMQRGVSTDYWYFQDDLSSTVAVADDGGNVLERVEYGDYGQPQVTDYATGEEIRPAPSNVGNPYLFTGRRYDAESGWYYYRTRYMEPAAGRFTTRDSIGIWGDAGNLGNGYAYVGNRPAVMVDPRGYRSFASIESDSPELIIDPNERIETCGFSCRDKACTAATDGGPYTPMFRFCITLIQCISNNSLPPSDLLNATQGCVKMLKRAGWTDTNISTKCGGQ